ncbi:hypothetical protein [Nocardioides dilutus]
MATTSIRGRSKRIGLITAALMLIGGGIAFAYWTNSGSGTGQAETGTNAAVTVNQDPITGLYPGQTQTLSGDFDNPNPGNTYVTAVTATGYTIDEAHVTAGCTVAGGHYTLGGTSNTPGDVPPGNGVGSWTGLTITMNNLATNQDACKGAIVTITYASS